MRELVVASLVSVVLASPAGAQMVTVTDSSPPEAKLAAIDAQGRLVQQSTITKFSAALDDLDRKCTEDRTQIANMVVTSVKLLADEKSVTMTHLKFMQSMNDSMPKGSERLNLSCAEIAAMLVTMINRP
jgi:hypothetical protein